MEIPILYEDADILALNKPAGLVVHSDGKTEEYTLTDWLLEKYPHIKGVGEPLVIRGGAGQVKKAAALGKAAVNFSSTDENGDLIIDRPGIVHRLDRDTSGVILIAKTQAAHAHLKSQFQDRETTKVYHAFVYGQIDEDEGVINRPIARSRNDFRLWSAQRGARGESREAVTHFKVIARTKEVTFIEASPKTGRTHQIRVHFKAINHPLVHDPLYAPKRPTILDFDRLALHARSLTFTTMNGEERTVLAPYPEDFKHAIALFKELRAQGR